MANFVKKFEEIQRKNVLTLDLKNSIVLVQNKNIETGEVYSPKILIIQKRELFLKDIGMVEKEYNNSYSIEDFKKLVEILKTVKLD